jgi:hypothetical protein
MRTLLLIAALLLTPAANAQTNPPTPAKPAPSDAIIGSARATLPQREAEYIGILQNTRRQYAAARSIDGRRNTRMAMQSAVHNFMGLSHSALDWVGVFKDSKKNPEASQSLEIEIAPGVVVATWDNPASDSTYYTMVKQFSALGKLIDGFQIGDEVVFSADLIGTVISSDDDMVARPKIIARFSKLQKIDATAPAK